MAGNLDAPPFATQDAVAVDDEGAAFDAAHLFAIHVFHFDDAEQIAHGFVAIRSQFEGKGLLGLEVFVRFQAVAGNAEDLGIDRSELGVEVAEVLAFGGAARRTVLGVEVDDDDLAGLGGQVEGGAAGSRQREVGESGVGHATLSGCAV